GMAIDQFPQIAKEAANGLAGANVNVLNGAEGLGELTAGLVAQGLTILDSVKRNLAASPTARAGVDPDADDGDGGEAPALPSGSGGGEAAREPGRGGPRQTQRPPGALDGGEGTREPGPPPMNARRGRGFHR